MCQSKGTWHWVPRSPAGVADGGAQSGAQAPGWLVDPVAGAAGGLLRMACPTGTPELSEAQRRELEKQLKAREELLLPMYYQVAVHFADLHDTPGRMQEKGVITVSQGRGGKGDWCREFCRGGTKAGGKVPSWGSGLQLVVPFLPRVLLSAPAQQSCLQTRRCEP